VRILLIHVIILSLSSFAAVLIRLVDPSGKSLTRWCKSESWQSHSHTKSKCGEPQIPVAINISDTSVPHRQMTLTSGVGRKSPRLDWTGYAPSFSLRETMRHFSFHPPGRLTAGQSRNELGIASSWLWTPAAAQQGSEELPEASITRVQHKAVGFFDCTLILRSPPSWSNDAIIQWGCVRSVAQPRVWEPSMVHWSLPDLPVLSVLPTMEGRCKKRSCPDLRDLDPWSFVTEETAAGEPDSPRIVVIFIQYKKIAK
jgi:hypothetical protein